MVEIERKVVFVMTYVYFLEKCIDPNLLYSPPFSFNSFFTHLVPLTFSHESLVYLGTFSLEGASTASVLHRKRDGILGGYSD